MAFPRNTYSSDSDSDRRWSDDQGFLDTINYLVVKSHEASMDDDNVMDWYFILEQLQLEITGQLVVRNMEQELKELKKIQEGVFTNLKDAYTKIGGRAGSLNYVEVAKLRHLVFPYHERINILLHKMDLRLHDVKPSDDGEVPTWAKN